MTSSVTAGLSSAAVASVMSSNFDEPDVQNQTSRTSSSHQHSPNRFTTLNIFCSSTDPIHTMPGTTTPSHHLDTKVTRNTRPVQVSKNVYGRGGEPIRNASHPIMLPPITATTNAVAAQPQCSGSAEYFQPTSKTKSSLSFAEVAAATVSAAKKDAHSKVSSYPANQMACWVLLNGQQVQASDLIGLRVAKTFVGHGRFLGQVLKFDEEMLSYTISYADGDQEVLSIEDTIQILVQDDVERPDPQAISALRDRVNDISVMETAFQGISTASISTLNVDNAREIPHKQVTEREAQFVQSLFETEALPVLLREGWRMVQAPDGAKQHYIAPSRDSQSSGLERRFTSPLEAVEYIASDADLLGLCFPPNVHGAILSLFPASNQETFGQLSTREISGYHLNHHTSTPVDPQHVNFDQRTCPPFSELRSIHTPEQSPTYIRGITKNLDYLHEQPNMLHKSGCIGGSNQSQMDSASFYRQMKKTPTTNYPSCLPTTTHSAPGVLPYTVPNRPAFHRDISMQDVDRHGATTSSNSLLVPSPHPGRIMQSVSSHHSLPVSQPNLDSSQQT